MRYGFLSVLIVLAFALVACNGDSSDKKFNLDEKLYNMALAQFGASISSETNPEELSNLIDGDVETFFESEPGEPILIELKAVENIVLFELKGEGFPTNISTHPSILIEFSLDGDTYFRSDVTVYPLNKDDIIPCIKEKSGTSSEVLRCVMEPAQAIKFIRITTKATDAPYLLSEVVAAAWKK